jgi:hypothetical protein
MLGANVVLFLLVVLVLVGAFTLIPPAIKSAVSFWREQQLHNEKLRQERLKTELAEQELINEQLRDEFGKNSHRVGRVKPLKEDFKPARSKETS